MPCEFRWIGVGGAPKSVQMPCHDLIDATEVARQAIDDIRKRTIVPPPTIEIWADGQMLERVIPAEERA